MGIDDTKAGAAAQPMVSLPQGRVRGRREGELHVFRGVPYAAPPFGERRFMPPQPVPHSPDTLDAAVFSPPAPQAPRDWRGNHAVVGGENCLTLNVWTGADVKAGERRPVLVWIPGGGFMRGSASDPMYSGAAFAQRGLVFVSLNYRLGIDGFLQLPDAPANRGLLDQIAALQWIHDHIAAFGGDPDAMTVGGSSAGAGSIACLLGLPVVQGLVRRAILQSPSVACQTQDEAEHAAGVVAQLLRVEATQQAMASVPLSAAVRVVAELTADYDLRQRHGLGARNAFALRPCIDGNLLKAFPLQALQQAWQSPGNRPPDLMVGANAEEMRFYLVPDGEIDRIDMARVHAFADACGAGSDAVQAYAASRPQASPGELLCAMQTDYYYREPARRLALIAQAAGSNARLYEFAWRSPACDGRLGAAHTMELPFVFDTLQSPHGLAFAGREAPAELATHMLASWVAFVATGQIGGWPAVRGLHGLRGQPVHAHDDNASALVMRFGEKNALLHTVAAPEALVWSY